MRDSNLLTGVAPLALIALNLLYVEQVYSKAFVKSECGTPDWRPFKDTKCYKVLTPATPEGAPNLKNYPEARHLCSLEHELSTLPSIESVEELKYVYSLGSSMGNIWLGAKEVNSVLVWDDGLESNYSNWHEDDLRNATHGEQCIQMETHRVLLTKWTFTPCNDTYNLVICQKPQSWAPSKIQKVAEQTRRQLQDAGSMEAQEQRISSLESNLKLITSIVLNLTSIPDEVYRLKVGLDEVRSATTSTRNSLGNASGTRASTQSSPSAMATSTSTAPAVPVGFVYVQYGDQVEPSILWPNCRWTEITANYAGMFFRAEGGQSARFGQQQNYNAPRLTAVSYQDLENHPHEVQINPGETSEAVRTGHWDSNLDKVGIVFTMSGGEVRPYNSAIKIWKRTG